MRMRVSASAPGKVILFGEHFVVHGNPAIVSSIDLRARVYASRRPGPEVILESGAKENPAIEAAKHVLKLAGARLGLSLRIESQIPQSVGLGSSAAVSVASAAATMLLLGRRLNLEKIIEAAHVGERLVHYTPSGIDTSIAALGGAGIYDRRMGYRRVEIGLHRLLIVNTGRQRKTGDLVRIVREFREENPEEFSRLSDEAKLIVEEALDALKSEDLERLGELMNRNQRLLRRIGVSSPEIEEAISLCLSAGAYGAKLTGAGGGGCIIAIADYDKLDRIAEDVSGRFQVFKARLVVDGVRAEPPPEKPP